MKILIPILLLLLVSCSSPAETPLNSILQTTGNLVGESMKEAGIQEYYVEVADDEVKIHFEAPPVKTDADVILEWTYIFIAASLQSQQEKITIIQYLEEVPLVQVTAEAEKVQELLTDKISFPDFADTLEVEASDSEWKCPTESVLIKGECY
ncbi:hypothetical protein ACFL1B_05475 [Nanoarchaeota archaeon]